jgi:hypothetical protein
LNVIAEDNGRRELYAFFLVANKCAGEVTQKVLGLGAGPVFIDQKVVNPSCGLIPKGDCDRLGHVL